MGQQSRGKRAGSRRGARPPRRLRRNILLLSLATTIAVVAWGYLVYAAIDFGSDARGGEDRAWGFLALAAIGAAACLFIALMLLARVFRTLATSPEPHPPAEVTPPRHSGGHRAD